MRCGAAEIRVQAADGTRAGREDICGAGPRRTPRAVTTCIRAIEICSASDVLHGAIKS